MAKSKPASLETRLGETVAAIGLLPPALRGAMRSEVYDILSHHRTSVLKRVGQTWPGGAGARKMVAARTFHFTKFNEKGIAGLEGEAFTASIRDFGDEAFEQFEHGETISAKGPMAIPGGAALTGKGKVRGGQGGFEAMLARRGFNISERGALLKKVGRGASARQELWGTLSHRRRQRPILGWHDRWNDVLSRRLPGLERVVDEAIKAPNQAALEARAQEARLAAATRQAVFRKYLDAHPGKVQEAREVARKAAAAMRQHSRAK